MTVGVIKRKIFCKKILEYKTIRLVEVDFTYETRVLEVVFRTVSISSPLEPSTQVSLTSGHLHRSLYLRPLVSSN